MVSGTIVDNFLLPFFVAVIAYWLFTKYDEWKSRKNYSLLGVAIMNCLLDEVNNGISIMRNQQTNPLPTASWAGPLTIPDEVLLRIIAISGSQNPRSFEPQDVRIHAKNYFEHMAPNWEEAVRAGNVQKLLKQGKYVEAAESVKKMLEQCRKLLDKNSRRKLPR